MQKANRIQRQGAIYALIKITQLLGKDLKSKLPSLWNYLYTNIEETNISDAGIRISSFVILFFFYYKKNYYHIIFLILIYYKIGKEPDKDSRAEKLICSLQVFEVLCPHIHDVLLPSVSYSLVVVTSFTIHYSSSFT